MINNRQGGRRRGRGGQRGQNLGGPPSGGNRQDNRQRGNAAQLLEKYKSMARDAQLSGDRVQSEYFLQFADHYFRVLGESRSRFEDQRRPRGDEGDEDEGDEEFVEASEETGAESAADDHRSDNRPEQRGPRRDGRDRERNFNRDERPRRNDSDGNGAERVNRVDERIPLEVLPPAIGRDDGETAADGESADERPRRRPRRPRPADGEGEIAPAA